MRPGVSPSAPDSRAKGSAAWDLDREGRPVDVIFYVLVRTIANGDRSGAVRSRAAVEPVDFARSAPPDTRLSST